MIQNIAKNFARKAICKLAQNSPRSVKSINYQEAKSVGVLYQVKDKDYEYFIQDFITYLSEEIGFKQLKVIGYYNQKKSPDFIANSSKFQIISKSDLKFNFRVEKQVISSFTNEEFDLLIDLSDGFIIPLKDVLAQSKARFKVGRYNEDLSIFYDFMINLPKQASVKEYLTQLNFYLNKINKNNG